MFCRECVKNAKECPYCLQAISGRVGVPALNIFKNLVPKKCEHCEENYFGEQFPHKNQCKAAVKCHRCFVSLFEKDLSDHEEHCPKRDLECKGCHRSFPAIELKRHYLDCGSLILCCDQYYTETELTEHHETSFGRIVDGEIQLCPNRVKCAHCSNLPMHAEHESSACPFTEECVYCKEPVHHMFMFSHYFQCEKYRLTCHLCIGTFSGTPSFSPDHLDYHRRVFHDGTPICVKVPRWSTNAFSLFLTCDKAIPRLPQRTSKPMRHTPGINNLPTYMSRTVVVTLEAAGSGSVFCLNKTATDSSSFEFQIFGPEMSNAARILKLPIHLIAVTRNSWTFSFRLSNSIAVLYVEGGKPEIRRVVEEVYRDAPCPRIWNATELEIQGRTPTSPKGQVTCSYLLKCVIQNELAVPCDQQYAKLLRNLENTKEAYLVDFFSKDTEWIIEFETKDVSPSVFELTALTKMFPVQK